MLSRGQRLRSAVKWIPMKASLANKSFRLWGGTALSVVCLILAFKGIRLSEIWKVLAQTNYGLIVLAFSTIIATALAQTVRWRLLFYPRHHQPRYSKLLAALLIGQMVNIVIPSRLGELARAYFLWEIEGEKRIALTLSTIAIEKLADMGMLFLLTITLLPFTSLPSPPQKPVIASITAAALLVALVVTLQKDGLLVISKHVLKFLPESAQAHIAHQIGLMLDGLKVLRCWRVNLQLLGWSVLIWLLAALTNYITFLALGLDLPFLAAILLLIVLHIGVAAPSSPGKIGVFHYLCIFALSAFSVGKELALSYSMILYVIVFLPPCISGAFFLWHESVNLRKLGQAAAKAKVLSGGPL